MIEAHLQTRAAATVAAVECYRTSAGRMGALDINAENRILNFEEKDGQSLRCGKRIELGPRLVQRQVHGDSVQPG